MHLLDNYIISPSARYESHRLIYTGEGQPIELTGMLAAAVIAALLVDTPEGDKRGIAIDDNAQREQFFLRYEREVRRENGGLFTTEVESLCQNYMELAGSDELLFSICGNDRLYDLAIGLMMDYMRRLVRRHRYMRRCHGELLSRNGSSMRDLWRPVANVCYPSIGEIRLRYMPFLSN